MNKVNHSLSAKLSLGIILLTVPVFVLSLGILFLQSRYYIGKEAAEHAGSVVEVAMHRVMKYMHMVETATNSNMWLVEKNFNPDSLQAISHRIVMLNRDLHSCSISAEPDMFPQCGRYFSVYTINRGDTVITVREPDYEYFNRTWYKTPVDKGESCWVNPFFEHTEGTVNLSEAVASYCKPIRQSGGRIVGVVSADLSLSLLAEAINTTEKDYPEAYFMLLGGEGRYFIHPDSMRLFRKTITSDIDPMEHADIIALGHEMITGKHGYMHVDIDGRLSHVSYMPVPGTDWSLAFVCPESAVMKSYNQLVYLICALIVVGLLFILWLCLRAVGHAVRPIIYLVGMSQKIADGHYDEAIPRTCRHDSVGRLQNNFATMQESLQRHVGIIRQTSEATKQRNEELDSAMRLAEEGVRQKSLFIQNVSHQIRTPLNIILGFAQVLHESPKLPDKDFKQISDMMKYNAMHLNRMVLMLFESSDMGASEERAIKRSDYVMCNNLARECVNYIQARFHGLVIRFETEVPDSLQILTNHTNLMRSMREILYNAAKYSDGQHISLRVSQMAESVRFTFTDVGPGLPPEMQNQLFKPFSKIDDLSEGLGLGLSLSRRHIISLGGELRHDSDYHDGCRFFIDVPKQD